MKLGPSHIQVSFSIFFNEVAAMLEREERLPLTPSLPPSGPLKASAILARRSPSLKLDTFHTSGRDWLALLSSAVEAWRWWGAGKLGNNGIDATLTVIIIKASSWMTFIT